MRLETNLTKNLMAYAQAFERCPEIKRQMDSSYGSAKHNIEDRDRDSGNPYTSGGTYHPVEEYLERATAYSDENDIANFKEYRRRTLESLEGDYKRITAASNALNTFVKYHKSKCGVFDPQPRPLHESCPRRDREVDDYTRGLLLLEDYVKSFKRSTTPDVALEIRKLQVCSSRPSVNLPSNDQQRFFEMHYSGMIRERLMNELDMIHERQMVSDIATEHPTRRRARKKSAPTINVLIT
jgi:hypothetical protein